VPEDAIGVRRRHSLWSDGTLEAEHVPVSSSLARRMDRPGVQSSDEVPCRRDASVGVHPAVRSRLDRLVDSCGYRAFRSTGLADAVACSAWGSRSLRASSRIRVGKGLPIADDPRPSTDPLAGVARVERRRPPVRPSRPEPPPTMTIQESIFSVGRGRAEALSSALAESVSSGC
jgi:hypothetical protein